MTLSHRGLAASENQDMGVSRVAERIAHPAERTRQVDCANLRAARVVAEPHAKVERLAPPSDLIPFLSRSQPRLVSALRRSDASLESEEVMATFAALRGPLESLHRDSSEVRQMSLAEHAPRAAAELEAMLARLARTLRSPSCKLACRAVRVAMFAKTAADWRAVEKLGAKQNAALRLSRASHRLIFAAFHDAERVVALYVAEPSVSAHRECDARVSAFFAERHHGKAPQLLFARDVAFAPAAADVEAFAMHDYGTVLFEDDSMREFGAWRARFTGITHRTLDTVERQIFVGHESAHFFAPRSLPSHLQELFADVGAFASVAEICKTQEESQHLVRAYVGSMLDYLRFGTDPTTVEEDGWYLHSAARMLVAFQDWGLIALDRNGHLHFTDDHAAFVRAAAQAVRDFDHLRAGKPVARYVTRTKPLGYHALQEIVRKASGTTAPLVNPQRTAIASPA